ncbi:MAG: hypothetical protein ACJAR2_000903 [Ilumatobacter sp.]|jgi:hypothetical protein
MPTEELPPADEKETDCGADVAAVDRAKRILFDAVPVLLAIVPFVLAAMRAAASTWVPIRDDAYFTARSLDVGTSNHPLLGAWSAGSLDVGKPVNNLGPMQLDLLAPFTRFTPMGGSAIGVVVVHIAAIVTIAWLIGRLAGQRYVLAAMVAVAVLSWSLGSEMLITPQQHQFLLFPYLCVLVAAWGVTCGDRWALVPAVVFASLAVQTHLSYPILVAALGIPMIVGQVLTFRRSNSVSDRRSGIAFVVSGVVAAVLWSQTAFEQFAGSGNFVNVLTSGGEGSPPSRGTALRIVAGVIASPQQFLRPGYGEFDPESLVGTAGQVVIVAVISLSVLIGFFIAARHGHRCAAAGLAVAGATLAAGILNATMIPATGAFGLLASNYRWLWSIGAFLLLGGLCLLVRLGSELWGGRKSNIVTGVLAVVLVVVTAANLPRSIQVPRADVYLQDQIATQEMLRQLELVELDGPVLIDQDAMYLGHPYTYPILVTLLRRGIDYRFESPVQARRFGDRRVSDGTETQRLVLSFGAEAELIQDSPDTVAYVDGSPPAAITLVDVPGST